MYANNAKQCEIRALASLIIKKNSREKKKKSILRGEKMPIFTEAPEACVGGVDESHVR